MKSETTTFILKTISLVKQVKYSRKGRWIAKPKPCTNCKWRCGTKGTLRGAPKRSSG